MKLEYRLLVDQYYVLCVFLSDFVLRLQKLCLCTCEICSEVLMIKQRRWFRHMYTCTEQERERDREIKTKYGKM